MSFATPASQLNMKLFRSLSALPASLRQTILLRPANISSPSRLRTYTLLSRNASTTSDAQPPNSTRQPSSESLIPPPSPTSGPLLSRLPNRALPNLSRGLTPATRTWLFTMPIFLVICALGSFSIFNYQKSSSSTVSSILYALRTSPAVRNQLGDEIYFNSQVPWISGELNQLHGNIDISFWVKGTKGKGLVKFVSVRRSRSGYFETLEWSLTTEDGTVLQLLEVDGRDPMAGSRTQQVIEEVLET